MIDWIDTNIAIYKEYVKYYDYDSNRNDSDEVIKRSMKDGFIFVSRHFNQPYDPVFQIAVYEYTILNLTIHRSRTYDATAQSQYTEVEIRVLDYLYSKGAIRH